MKMARQYLPIVDVCLKPKEAGGRETMMHLFLEREHDDPECMTGRLCAADGFILAVVPVTLGPDDVPGLIFADALRQVAKASIYPELELTVTADAVVAPNGARQPRYHGSVNAETQWFGYRRITPVGVADALGMMAKRPLAVNPVLTAKLGKALGEPFVILWPNPEGDQHPVVVTPAPQVRPNELPFDPETGLPTLPYGVQMPAHVTLPSEQLPPAARDEEEAA